MLTLACSGSMVRLKANIVARPNGYVTCIGVKDICIEDKYNAASRGSGNNVTRKVKAANSC